MEGIKTVAGDTPTMDDVNCANCIDIDSRQCILQIINGKNLLLFILFVKVILNWLILSLNRRKLQSLIGYFCVSLSLMDFALFTCMTATSLLKTSGTPVGFNHICLQFFSSVYSVLHFPIYLLSGLDYFVNLRSLSKSISSLRRILYILTVILLWIGSIIYVFYDCNSQSIKVPYFLLHQCYISKSTQSLILSALILLTLILVTLYCWSNLTSLVRSLHIDSYQDETVMMSSHPAALLQPQSSKKQVLTNIIMCFSLTWMPFILFQFIIVLVWAPLPAYMDLNVPSLCFINSFLIGTVYWLNHRTIPPKAISLIPDGFCNWECCKIQAVPQEYNERQIPDKEVKRLNILMV
ncbi:probable G-protein coupled receptor 160 [Narcine bancroftii]|uniref:probable G-protein coupled receptor 160 n=1 Tax=Narcine bancroftii TaxID=1343680 RepID=UPI0038312C8C